MPKRRRHRKTRELPDVTPLRQCFTKGGLPKRAFDTAEEAWKLANATHQQVYRCGEGHYHLTTKKAKTKRGTHW